MILLCFISILAIFVYRLLGFVHVIIVIDIGILPMHIFTISFPTSLQALVGGIVTHKLGTGFYFGSLVGGINKIYVPD